jgi:hypothetical protein
VGRYRGSRSGNVALSLCFGHLIACWFKPRLRWPVCVGAECRPTRGEPRSGNKLDLNHLDSPPSQSPPHSSCPKRPRLGRRRSRQMPPLPPAAVLQTPPPEPCSLSCRFNSHHAPDLLSRALPIAGHPSSCVLSPSLGRALQGTTSHRAANLAAVVSYDPVRAYLNRAHLTYGIAANVHLSVGVPC